MIGYHVPETKEINDFLKEYYKHYNNEFYCGDSESGANVGNVVIGIKLMDISEDDPEADEVELSKLNEYSEKIYKEFGEKLGLDKKDIKLISGVRLC